MNTCLDMTVVLMACLISFILGVLIGGSFAIYSTPRNGD